MRVRRLIAGSLALAPAACGAEPPPAREGWRAEMSQVRLGVQGAEDDPALAERWDAYRGYLEAVTGLPVRIYESNDYNGRIQALSAGQIELATIGAGSYANVDAQVGELAAPILTGRQAEGAMGYYSALLVRANSPYRTIADLAGKSLGYVDFNSTSGYLFPRARMRAEGVDPERFFGRSGFAGGHTQAVMALQNGQFDAVIINVSGGDPETGFTTGAQFTMANRGLVDIEDFRMIWFAGPIPNSPLVVRADRPQAFIDLVRGAMAALPYDEPEIWTAIGQSPGGAYAAVDRAFYEEIIALRDEELALRRGRGGQGGGE